MQTSWGMMGQSATPPPVIGGIVRVSTKGQGQGQSPDNQRQVLAQAGATVFFEAVESGFKSKRRESLQPLFDAIRQGKLTKLLATDLSRAARSDKLLDELITICDQHGVEFLAGGLTISHGSAYEWFSAKQMQLQAELYSRDLSGRIKRGQSACISRGVFGFTSRHVAWHLQKDPDDKRKVIAHPDRWDDAKRVIHAYLDGTMSMAELCADIYAKHGVLRLSGAANKWLKSGWIRGHYSSRKTGEVLIANIAPPLLTEEEHRLLMLRIDGNRKEKGSRAPHRKHALTGLCRCVHCDHTMTTMIRKGRGGKVYRYVRCAQPGCPAELRNVRMDKAEAAIQELLDEVDLEVIERSHQQRQQVTKPSKELLNLRTHVKRLREALALIESPGVKADLLTAERRVAELEAAHQAEPPRLSLREVRELGSEQWWSQRDDAQRNLDYLSTLEYAAVDAAGDWRGVTYLKYKGWCWTEEGYLVPED